MNCSSCGAPLPQRSNVCRFCGKLNDTDLRTVGGDARRGSGTARCCPRCETNMRSLTLADVGGVTLDRCDRCLGIFFDPGELETLLDKSVSQFVEVDYGELQRLVREEARSDYHEVRYVRCPDCGELMHRKAYGSRSGIVVDRCRNHGVWLDGGELGRLVKWSRAGGRQHHEAAQAAAEREAQRKVAIEIPRLGSIGSEPLGGRGPEALDLGGVLRFLVGLIR